MNTKKNLLASTIAFFMGSAVQGVVAQDEVGGQEENEWALEEIIVTATKRGTTLQDTAMAISALSGEAIDKRGLVDMNDYLATIPGASYINAGTGGSNKKVVLRGLSVKDRQSTASVYLGEMPMSSAVSIFDINLVDIERIEVVKGPQGTLYGSNSLGGIVRNIPNKPSLESIEGSVKVDVSVQDESNDSSQSLVGVFNVPLIEDQLALRVASYKYKNAGYIDIVSTPEVEAVAAAYGSAVIVKEDDGGNTVSGGRVSLLWKPIDDLEINITHGTQKNDIDGRLDVSSNLDGYQVSYLNTKPSQNSEIDYSNLIIEYDFGWASLLSSSSLIKNEEDYIKNIYPTVSTFPAFGPIDELAAYSTEIKSQELRLMSDLDGAWQYLVGFFYEDAALKTEAINRWSGSASSNPYGPELLADLVRVFDYSQNAVFGEISYQFNEQWLLTLGGRYFEYDRIDTDTWLGGGPFNGIDSKVDSSESGDTYKVNLAYHPSDDTLIYGQWSEGFRLGRGQSLPNLDLCDTDNDGKLDFTDAVLTNTVETDTTENMELGLKFSLLDSRLMVNTVIFRTEWDNLPVSILNTSETCPASTAVENNIGEARSQGIEFEAMYLMDNWLLSLAASYMDTERTNVRSPLTEGEHLVFAPRTNASVGLQYDFTLAEYSGFVRTDLGYVGRYESAPSHNPAEPAGDYVDANIRLGISKDQWELVMYGTNLSNNDELRFSVIGGDNPVSIHAPPRTLGLSLSYNF